LADESGNTISHAQNNSKWHNCSYNDCAPLRLMWIVMRIPAKPDLIFVDNCSTVSTPIFTEHHK
jgi:hypothetical protein